VILKTPGQAFSRTPGLLHSQLTIRGHADAGTLTPPATLVVMLLGFLILVRSDLAVRAIYLRRDFFPPAADSPENDPGVSMGREMVRSAETLGATAVGEIVR
jgi:hypothetical protein